MNKVADCHEPAPPPDCTMGQAEGAPCAMHHMHGSTDRHAAPPAEKPAGDCAIRGLCGGPLSAIFAIFSTQGVLPDRIESLSALDGTSTTLTVTDQLIGLFVPPDAPPPRAERIPLPLEARVCPGYVRFRWFVEVYSCRGWYCSSASR